MEIEDPKEQVAVSEEDAGKQLADRMKDLNKMKMRLLRKLEPTTKILHAMPPSQRNSPAAREARAEIKLELVRHKRTKAERKRRRQLARQS